jgi:hypothetical protein
VPPPQKHQSDLHLRVWDGKLYVDCARLSEDFRRSYEDSFRQRLGDATVRQTAEANADRFMTELVRDAARYGKLTDARTLAAQVALLRGIARFDLRRCVTFHSRVARARQFADSLLEASASLSAVHTQLFRRMRRPR